MRFGPKVRVKVGPKIGHLIYMYFSLISRTSLKKRWKYSARDFEG